MIQFIEVIDFPFLCLRLLIFKISSCGIAVIIQLVTSLHFYNYFNHPNSIFN